MDDEKEIRLDDQEEYHFTETPETDVFADAAPTRRVTRGGLTARNIIIAIGLLILIVVLYKLMGVFVTPKKAQSPSTQTTTTQTSNTQTQQPIQPVQPTTEVPPITSAPTQTQADLANQITTLQSNDTQRSNQIAGMQNQLNNLSASVAALQSNMSTITTQLQTIANSLQQRQQPVKVQKPKAPIVKAVPVKIMPPPPPKYYIQAIIPGRAWLILPNGNTLTVAVGDKLSGYGFITNINPARGMVRTSSGAIIYYKNS